MTSSQIKANLFSNENTPAKAVVSYDINSWLQTNLKQSPQKRQNPKSFSRRPSVNRIKPTKSSEFNNIGSLKDRQTDLMRSTAKVLSRALTTRASTNLKKICTTAQQNNSISNSKQISEFKIKLHAVKVSEFSEDVSYPGNLIRHHIQKPPIITKSINTGTKVSRKGTLPSSNYIQSKVISHRNLQPSIRRNANFLYANPEANLVFKTRRILSVHQPNPLL